MNNMKVKLHFDIKEGLGSIMLKDIMFGENLIYSDIFTHRNGYPDFKNSIIYSDDKKCYIFDLDVEIPDTRYDTVVGMLSLISNEIIVVSSSHDIGTIDKEVLDNLILIKIIDGKLVMDMAESETVGRRGYYGTES